MNGRTKLLLVAMLLVAVIWLGDSGYRNLIANPTVQRDREITELQERITKAQNNIVDASAATDQLDALQRISLPTNRELARARYQDWLLDLVQKTKLDGASVDAGNPSVVTIKDRETQKPKEIYYRYAFSLRGRGSLQQVTQLLYEFYQGGHLHQIRSIGLNPVAGGRLMDLTVSIEALGLSRCEREEELSRESFTRLASTDLMDYQTISRRNLFARHGDAVMSGVVLTAITVGAEGALEAWFTIGGGETKVLKRGDEFAVSAHSIEVVDILAGQVLVDVDGRVLTVASGQNIQEAEEASLSSS